MRLSTTLCIGICIFFALSCSRTNQPIPRPSPDPGPAPDPQAPVAHALPLLDSFIIYTLGPKEITFSKSKMKYDGSGRLTDVYSATTDSAEDGQPLRQDTLDFILTYRGSDTLPIAYTNYTADLSALADHGFISYDDQGRMSQDSGTNGQNSWLYKYQYDERQIIQNSSFGTDSIIIVNNNVVLWKEFMNIYSFTYSDYLNPFYQPALAKHIIPLMVFNGIDIFSKNLYNSSTSQYVNNNPYQVINYSWTTNANGQVISGTGTDSQTGAIIQYFWFTYL
jgi:hypothetical protein